MVVKEYALAQLHWRIRADPWVREIFLAAGVSLDALAERIVALYNRDNFDALTAAQCAYYEGLLGLAAGQADLETRRAAIRAAWCAGAPPTVAGIQAVCDNWRPGAVRVRYDPEAGLVWLTTDGSVWAADDLSLLRQAVERVIPAHLGQGLQVEHTPRLARRYVGTAGQFGARTTLRVDGASPETQTWLTDEGGGWLLEETGSLLFE